MTHLKKELVPKVDRLHFRIKIEEIKSPYNFARVNLSFISLKEVHKK